MVWLCHMCRSAGVSKRCSVRSSAEILRTREALKPHGGVIFTHVSERWLERRWRVGVSAESLSARELRKPNGGGSHQQAAASRDSIQSVALLLPWDLKTVMLVCRRWREVGEAPTLWAGVSSSPKDELVRYMKRRHLKKPSFSYRKLSSINAELLAQTWALRRCR